MMVAAISSAVSAQAPAVPAGAPAAGPAAAQTPATAQTPAAAPLQAAAPATAADMLQPALSNARSTLMSIKLDRWKKGSVRDEAESNVKALLSDLDNNMQPLVTAADAAPGQLSKAIPLVKHLDAFYDVLLRVEEGSRVVAPGEQVDALQAALLRVSQARIAYDDVLETQATGQEKQVIDLQATVKTEQDSVKEAEHQAEVAKTSAASTPCKPATPARRKRSTTAAKKPAPAQSTQPAQPAQKPQ
jgi:hypothetical protein